MVNTQVYLTSPIITCVTCKPTILKGGLYVIVRVGKSIIILNLKYFNVAQFLELF